MNGVTACRKIGAVFYVHQLSAQICWTPDFVSDISTTTDSMTPKVFCNRAQYVKPNYLKIFENPHTLSSIVVLYPFEEAMDK